MTLGGILTSLLRPCTSAPKSPSPLNSPNKDERPIPAKGGCIVEVTPCMEITNKDLEAEPSPVLCDENQDKAHSAPKTPASSPNQSAQSPEEAAVTTKLASPAVVTEAATSEAEALILKIFGFEVLSQLQAKTWDERGQAVQATRARVVQSDLQGSSVRDFFTSACAVARQSLTDKVMPVFFDSLDLVKLLLGEFATKHDLGKDTIRKALDSLIPLIVAKTSDRNARSMEGTRAALVFLARQPAVGVQPVMTFIVAEVKSAKDIQSIRGRLELIHHFIDEFGFSKNSALSLSAVMTFVRPHLDATDEKVRRTAVEVTVASYTLKGERTLKYCSNLKPALLKLLEQRFAEVDGKNGGKKSLPAVRGPKTRKGAPKKTGVEGRSQQSSRQSSSTSAGSMGSRGKNGLAPLEMGPNSGRIPADLFSGADPFSVEDSRRGDLGGLVVDADRVETDALHADLFAPSGFDVTPAVTGQPDRGSAVVQSPQYGMAIDPKGHSSLAMMQEDPHYIPSPPPMAEHDRFGARDNLDEAFMNEIEGL